jgi:putative membrane protein
MTIVTKILIVLIVLEHLYFLWLEMFAWTTRGPKAFPKQPKNSFETSKTLAANQGLYNGFLAAGLVWSLFIQDSDWAQNVAIFFLLCIVVAGIYGSLYVERKIVFAQTLPAVMVLLLLKLS